MTRMIIKPKALSETLQKYEAKFGHRPSAEAYKFSTDQEINYLASKALLDGQPVEDWESRPLRKTGTILDALYDDPVASDTMKNTRSSGIVKKVSTKELREIAIAKEEARQWLAKKEKKVKQDNSTKTTEIPLPEKSTPPARDYSITHSNAQNLYWEVEKVRNKKNSVKQDTAEHEKKESYLESNKQLIDDTLLMPILGGLALGLMAFLADDLNIEVGVSMALYCSILFWLVGERTESPGLTFIWYMFGGIPCIFVVVKFFDYFFQ